ncbi:hypothetical protein R9K98_00190, partial [Escherichia coli]
SDGNGSHASTLKSPSYTKSVSWQHYPRIGRISTKERENCVWLKRRLFYYTTPFFSSLLALHKGPRLPDD